MELLLITAKQLFSNRELYCSVQLSIEDSQISIRPLSSEFGTLQTVKAGFWAVSRVRKKSGNTTYTLHPQPYMNTTYTLYPQPFTLHSTPCTLHPRRTSFDNSRFHDNCFPVLRRGSKEVTYLRLVDVCITHLQAESNHARPFVGVSQKSIFKRPCQFLAINAHKMAPRTTQWLQELPNGSKNYPMAPRTTLECPH